MKSYSEMIQIPTFEERIKYLKTNSSIGIETFSFERWINQNFYLSKEWQNIRNRIIVRDLGHDVAMPGVEYLINGIAVVHHINPLTKEQLVNGDTDAMFNPQNLVVVSKDTHNMIHFGHILRNKYQVEERCPNDTIPWRCENGY